MNDWLDILGADRYTPWSVCLADDTATVFFYTLTNTLAMISYIIIGVVMFLQYLTHDTTPAMDRRPLALLYAAFIFLCGLSRFTQTLTLHLGVYRLDILISSFMTGIALAAAIFTLKDFLRRA